MSAPAPRSVREVRLLRDDHLITRSDARTYLGLPLSRMDRFRHWLRYGGGDRFVDQPQQQPVTAHSDPATLSANPDPAQAPEPLFVPDDLFACVVGLEYEKAMLRTVVTSARPLHAVLVGAPGCAKSLMLDELRRVSPSRMVSGPTMSSAGLLEMVLAPNCPAVLLIDEVEKCGDAVALNTLLGIADGKVTRMLSTAQVEQRVDVRIVCAANSIERLHPALRSRFVELPLPEYTLKERRAVILGVLTGREGLDAAQAGEIADLCAPQHGDIRDAQQVAVVSRSNPALARELVARLGRVA